jgi:hypothetical protein
MDINDFWLRGNSVNLSERIELHCQSDDLLGLNHEEECIYIAIEASCSRCTNQLGLTELISIVILNISVTLSKVGIFAQVVDIQFGCLHVVFVLSNICRTVFKRNLDDFVEAGFIDILIFLVDTGDGAISTTIDGVDCSKFNVLSVLFVFRIKN